jgi:hypothetical protein
MQVAVVELPELMDPVRQLDVGIAPQLGEGGRGFDAAKQGEVEFAEQGTACDRHQAMPATAPDTATPVDMSGGRCTHEPALALFLSTPHPLCFLEWARFWRSSEVADQAQFQAIVSAARERIDL